MSPQRTDKASDKTAVACDNHPDRDAVMVTDGKAHEELHLCAECVPPGWSKDH